MLGRVRVAGHSMEPSLRHGDTLVYLRLPLHAGAVVVAEDPRDDRLVVKRVAAIDGDDVILASDAPGHESLLVERRAVLGRVVLRY
ncbi:MAG: S24/S26 family peptidase [Chloroflexota bacterium]|nr:S24/S26 family peptidase [Chloroflexota bacterium]MDE3192658.1 S24/S26 family peptidase [Chloroflexota bacterium]